MSKFLIGVREVWVSTRQIEADSFEEAKEKIREGEGEETLLEYSHTLDSENWSEE